MIVTEDNNFLRLFELPKVFPEGFLFGGGKPVQFTLVNWFNPVPGNKPTELAPGENHAYLREFIRSHKYYDPKKQYVAITDYGDAFMI